MLSCQAECWDSQAGHRWGQCALGPSRGALHTGSWVLPGGDVFADPLRWGEVFADPLCWGLLSCLLRASRATPPWLEAQREGPGPFL